MSDKKNASNNTFALNAVIGFLSLLLTILVFALITRVVFPRINNERAEQSNHLIGNIIQLEVLNGCGVPGLATRFTSKLRKNGFDVVETGNFDNFDMKETIVIARSGKMENALRVAKALGIPQRNVLQEESPDYYLDATVVIGADYKSINLD